MKIIIYSANIDNYDDFKKISVEDPSVRYILFTDNKIFRSKTWEISHVDFLPNIKDKRRISRYLKVNSHLVLPNHDISIWIDHCFSPKIKNAIDFLLSIGFNDQNIMCFQHDWRNCLYKESEEVKNLLLDDVNLVNEQIYKYKNEGFPQNLGLFSTGFLIRRNNEQIKNFNETWWNQINNYSGRDQLSQMYSSWKTNVKIGRISDLSVYNNPWISQKIKHSKKWSI